MSPSQPLGDPARAAPAPRGGTARTLAARIAPALPAAFALTVWWKLRQLLYHTHWGRGPTIFLLLIACCALVLAVPVVARILERRVPPATPGAAAPSSSRPLRWIAAALFAAALLAGLDDLRELRRNLAQEEVALLDIGGNTWAAAVRFADFGQNPYTHRTQLHPVTGAPGVTVEDGQVEMYGVPYFYGYPYFPAMFLSYAPFRLFHPGQHSIRIGNAVWLALLFGGVAWLAARLAPAGSGALAGGLAALLLTVTTGLGNQLFYFGVTDMLIALYAVAGLVALTYGRHFLCGALLGLAFAAKLLPGLLIAAVTLVWLQRRGGLRPALLGFALPCVLVLLPFVAWHPAGFFSATILFYLTHHAAGDTTSLWYFLPPVLRSPFLGAGALLVVAATLAPWWTRGDDQRDLLRLAVLATFLFLAFNKMIHLNYQFAVVPLACAALAADAMGSRRRWARADAPDPTAAERSPPAQRRA